MNLNNYIVKHIPTGKFYEFDNMTEDEMLDVVMMQEDGDLANYKICEQIVENEKVTFKMPDNDKPLGDLTSPGIDIYCKWCQGPCKRKNVTFPEDDDY